MTDTSPPTTPKPPEKQGNWERRIETALWNSRFLVMLAAALYLMSLGHKGE
ncbi:MAG: hypothetical protein ACTHZY_06940 [Halomonas sp.]|uniref:hypothetical protein n=1 Tax=unclassified Halomonas TaxID=2609666 RepID=UPI0026533C86|nr:hypothetical protein [Halomonas sp.]